MRLVGLGISWTIATFAGYVLATFLGIGSFLGISILLGCNLRSILPAPDSCSDLHYLSLLLATLIGGAGLGLTQFAILRLFRVPTNAWWIPATCLGFAIPVALEIGFTARISLLGGTSFFLLLGLSLGTAQWLILRRRVPKSAIWIAATVISTLVAGLVSSWTVGSPFIWLVVGAGTALTLIWLIRPGLLRESAENGA